MSKFIKKFTQRELQFTLGILAIFISCSTWILDLTDLAMHCIYCRTERSVIGIMGVLMISPVWYSHFSRFIFYPVGFLGAHVAAAQIFLHFQHADIWKITFVFSSAALCIIIGLMMFMWERLLPLPVKKK